MKSNNTNAGATNASSASGEGGQNPVVTPTKPPSREHVLSKDCWCQPTLDGEAPDEVSLSEQIEHQRSIYDGDTETFGAESEWTIKSGSILASLLELQLRRDSAPAADTVVVPVEMPDQFSDWLESQMPPGTRIASAKWWAPKIYRAMLRAAKEEGK